MPTSQEQHAGFALTLHKLMAPDPAENTVCSPWSVSTALAALTAGADEPTRAALVEALGAGTGTADPARLAADAAAVAAGRSSGGESVLSTTTTLWVDEAFRPTRGFTDALAGWPGSAVRPAPIVRAPEAARQAVNTDVAELTRKLIPEILPHGSVTSDDRAVLVNALYLLAAWLVPFDRDATTEGTFHGADASLQVPMMRAVREIRYAATSGWRYAALPLELGLRAEILLPDADLQQAEPALHAGLLTDLRGAAADARVTLSLPRFRVSGGGDLCEPLVALGLGRLLDPAAEPLPSMVEGEPLCLTAAYHRAVLRVDERGVEGAAATAMMAGTVAFRVLPEVEMIIDRPFLVLVTHLHTGAVPFVARVARP